MKKAIVFTVFASLLTSCVKQPPRINYREMPCNELYAKMIEIEKEIERKESNESLMQTLDSISAIANSINGTQHQKTYKSGRRDISDAKIELLRVENTFYAKQCRLPH